MSDDIDPALVAVLEQLWRAREGSPQRAWSLAKLAKQSGLPMSTLRRQLTGLEEAGLVQVTINEDGTGSAWLSEQGATLCQAVFGAAG
ncbi:helix-turn-helix domain-containing protein [Caballeronia sp. LZ034LL]|uniref:helix-turn-helix domain-containing protein n=1 Tax=Caballeronia sp. LZ034LL TaxID=3038567 RepID=UPI0028644F34|nr:helix-turn-helix domain-containing protein [Caballeronia sp. LZ034LL]MDR5838957.1 helix-turn-helix domain-containing protein [Caballeronia sp. LZ034LL]